MVAASVLAPLLFGPAVATASPPCDDDDDWGEATSLLPADGAVGVATDALIWLEVVDSSEDDDAFFPTPPLRLRDSAGDDVPLEYLGPTGGQAARMVAWRPVGGLTPDSAYEAECESDDWDGICEDAPADQAFSTGAGISSSAPYVPDIDSVEMRTYPNEFADYCGGSWAEDHVAVHLSSAAPINVLFRATRAGEEGPADPLGGDGVDSAGTSATAELAGEIPPATRLHLRAGSMDLAGRFSGWSEERSVTMPAAGCSSSRSFGEAALCLAFLLAGGGLLRRGRRSPWLAALAAMALPILAAPPLAQAAEDPSAERGDVPTPDDPPPAEEAPASPPPAPGADAGAFDWRTPLAARLATASRGWGVAAAFAGAVQVGFLVALPFRAPAALSGTVGCAIGWLPTLAGLVSAVSLRQQILRGSSASRVELAIRLLYVLTIPLCVAAVVAAFPGVAAGFLVDSYGGVSAAIVGLAASALVANIQQGVVAGQLKRQRIRGVAARPAAAVLAAGPTGVVIAF